MSDFVAAPGKIGDFHARPDAAPHAFSCVREPAHRLGDGAGQEDREYDHNAGRYQKDFEDREPFGFDHVVDVGALGR